ncbi:MAG: MATE family efflux transporter [Coriobacteriales bacterium]|nr:MATE family efflux transporter [Coriobacteriales bacterium]
MSKDTSDISNEAVAGQGKPFDLNSPTGNPLGDAPVPQLLLKYAPPAILSMMITALYNIIDTFFVGHAVGQDGIAATTVAFPLMMLMSAFSAWFGAGGNALAALKLGEGKKPEAERIMGNSLFMLVAIPGTMSILALTFLDPLLTFLGATEANRHWSQDFCTVILAGFVIQAVGVGISNFVRTDGAPNYALLVNLVGTLAAVFFNWLLVMVYDYKMTGSAFATILGQAVTTLMVLQYFLSKRSHMKFALRNFKPVWAILCAIAALGLSTFAVQMAGAFTSSMLNIQINNLAYSDPIGADGGLAVIGTVNKVIQLLLFVTLGFAIAVQPIIGFNYGAQRYVRVRSALWITVAAASLVNLVLWILCHIFISPIMAFFNLDASLHGFAAEAFMFMTFMFPIVPFQIVCSNYFQATGQPLKATTLTLTRQLIFYLPSLFLVPPLFASILGRSELMCLTAAPSVADFLAIITTGIFIIIEMKRLDKLIAQHEERAQGRDSSWAQVGDKVQSSFAHGHELIEQQAHNMPEPSDNDNSEDTQKEF